MAAISLRPIDSSPGNLLRYGGAYISIFSVVIGLLVLFAIPVACSYVGSIQLVILGLLFVLGVMAFLAGTVFSWRRRKGKAG